MGVKFSFAQGSSNPRAGPENKKESTEINEKNICFESNL